MNNAGLPACIQGEARAGAENIEMSGSDSPKDPNPRYWDNYGNLQRVKHALVKRYLDGWYPKLGSWSGKVLYVDTHAGRTTEDGARKWEKDKGYS